MGFRNFDRAQAEFERRRLITPEDEDDEYEKLRQRKEYSADRADYLRDRAKDED